MESIKSRKIFKRGAALALWIGSTALFMSACGLDFKQDPLANTSGEIKDNLKPISAKPEPSPTPATFEFQIDHKAYFVFEEEVAGEEFIKSRILTKIGGEEPELGKNYHIRIGNLGDFTGATFDEMSGRFSWRPALGAAGGEPFGLLTLVVWLETAKGVRLGHPREIPVHVRGHKAEPTIVSVDDLETVALKEGEKREFKVRVKDLDSVAGEEPKLIVLGASGSKVNIAPHVEVAAYPISSLSDPTLWEFKLVLNADGLEATRDTDKHSFLLVAISRYGQHSEPRLVNATFKTSVVAPDVTWDVFNDVFFLIGQSNRYDFVVMDPKAEGTLRVNFTECPSGASCGCESPRRAQPLVCRVTWNVDPSEWARTRAVRFTAENESPLNGEPPATRNFQRSIRLRVPPPTPTPLPVPTP